MDAVLSKRFSRAPRHFFGNDGISTQWQMGAMRFDRSDGKQGHIRRILLQVGPTFLAPIVCHLCAFYG